ncbi:DUF2157 domain-containing protein [Roseateles sp. BYS87W]|uniref:DUF2157 domain-containing protein n=1 Tax=Pelomonas baiyunensis TaxID=3299026 RepID=A0ABW7H0S4_9BURK
MNWPSVVAERAAALNLSEAQRQALLALAAPEGTHGNAADGTGWAPQVLTPARLPALAMGLAVALVGLGLILAVAANWAAWPRSVQFAVLQGAVAAGVVGLVALPRWRMPWGLWCLLSTGGLLAFFGQTYQTGADPWQLFALWAALCVPLALGVRADTVWCVWTLVALTGVALWMTAQGRHSGWSDADDLSVHLTGWGLSLALVLGLNSAAGRRLGAGAWARRLAACGAVSLVTGTATVALFNAHPVAEVTLGLAALSAVAWGAARRATFEVFVLSAAALGLNVLLVGAWIRMLFSGSSHGDFIGSMLMTGLFAAGLLAASVSWVMRCQRAFDAHMEAAR